MRTFRLFATLAAVAAFTISSAERADASEIVVGTTDRAVTLDPAGAWDHGSQQLIGNLFQTLLAIPAGGNTPVPDAAQRCRFQDRTTYVCTLRRGLRFSNGEPLTAADVKFSLERVLRIADPSGPATLLQNLERVRTGGSRTVKMHLRRADATWPSVLAQTVGAIVPKRRFPTRKLLADSKVIGSGPYKLDRYVAGRHAVLSANPRFAGAKAKTQRVTVRSFPSSALMKAAIERGELDVAFRGFSSAEVAQLRAEAPATGLHVVEGSGPEIHYLVFDVHRAPVDNLAVRQAIAQLIDRAALARTAYADTVTPLYSLVPATIAGAKPAFLDTYGAPSVASAQALLAAAGVSIPVTLDAWYTPARYGPEEAAAMEEIRRQLEASGLFRVNVGAREWEAYKTSAFDRHAFPLYGLGWFADVVDADSYLSPLLRSGGYMQNGYANATMHALLDQQLASTKQAERAAALSRIQDLVARDVPVLPLWERKQIAVLRPGVEGVERSFDPALQMRFRLLSKR